MAFNRASEAMTPDLAGVSVVLEGCSAADLPLLSVKCVSFLCARAGTLSEGSRSLGHSHGHALPVSSHGHALSWSKLPPSLTRACRALNAGGMMGRHGPSR